MSRTNRLHKVRVRGCYECSQRRISCDLAAPFCRKCKIKDIHCSGYGTRYRFADDLFAQGKVPGGLKTFTPRSLRRNCASRVRHLKILDATDRSSTTCGKVHFSNAPTVQTGLILSLAESPDLFRCFSEEIAPIMVVVDDVSNPWRCLVLPLARVDGLVRSAVLSTTIFYISTRLGHRVRDPYVEYHRVIRKLRERQNLSNQDTIARQGILTSLLLSLTTAKVSALPDSRRIFDLIELFLLTTDCDDTLTNGDLGPFLLNQIEKYRGYASPFLSRDRAGAILSMTTFTRPSVSRGWNEFTICCKSYPRLDSILSTVYDLSAWACNFYMKRLMLGQQAVITAQDLQNFREKIESLPTQYLVDPHSLIWSAFIAAFESITLEDQAFFSDFFIRQYNRLGFANILTALAYLKAYWKRQVRGNWIDTMTNLQIWIF